jgi:hypothetical protein
LFNASQDVRVNVIAVNDPPQIGDVPNLNVYEDQQFTFDITPYLSDIDNDITDLTISTNSSHATIVDKNITFFYSSSDGITYEHVKIVVTDGDLTDHCNITVTVVAEGVLYVFVPVPTQNAVEDIDLVVDMADYITLSESISFTDITFEVSSSYGEVSGTLLTFNYPNSFNYPSGRTQESVQVNFTHSNEEIDDSATLKINVLPVNDAPYLLNPDVDPDSGNEDTDFIFSVRYYDIDGSDTPEINVVIDDVSYEMNYISGSKTDEIEGALYQFTSSLFRGLHNYYFDCNDMAGEFNSYNWTSTFQLTVADSDGEPPISNDADKDGIPDSWEEKYGLNPNDPSDANSDPDGDNYTNLQEYLGLDGKPSGGDDTNPQDISDYPKKESGDGQDDKDTDDYGMWLIIGGLLVVVILVLIIVFLIVQKRKKREPESYPHPEQVPPGPEPQLDVAPPPEPVYQEPLQVIPPPATVEQQPLPAPQTPYGYSDQQSTEYYQAPPDQMSGATEIPPPTAAAAPVAAPVAEDQPPQAPMDTTSTYTPPQESTPQAYPSQTPEPPAMVEPAEQPLAPQPPIQSPAATAPAPGPAPEQISPPVPPQPEPISDESTPTPQKPDNMESKEENQ